MLRSFSVLLGRSLLAAFGALQIADVITTKRVLENGGWEANPLGVLAMTVLGTHWAIAKLALHGRLELPRFDGRVGARRACLGHHVSFRIRWGKDTQAPRVATGRVVEVFDELKDGHPRLAVEIGSGADRSARIRGWRRNSSHIALS